jgi:SM-20-related protein
LVDGFIDNKIGVTENFLSKTLASHLKENLILLFTQQQLLSAGTGNSNNVVHNKLMRSDVIYWLDRKHNNKYENDFFDLIDRFVIFLNSTCYTGITDYEFHYTLYEKGSFYKKHIDQFKNNNGRQYSMIMYLNEDWQLKDGGELCIHHADYLQHISPNNGKTVFFKSNELAHEVLITNKARMSITGWLKV